MHAILDGRGHEQAASVLGEDFAANLVRDGWAPYRKFEQAGHQTCLGHLLRRCRELLETARQGAARFPHAVKRLLQDALSLRDRCDEMSDHGFRVARGRIEARADRLLAWNPTVNANRKLAKHLRSERDALFTFLYVPGLEATNWRAEQAIRPAVVTRKVWGGNRTWAGAATQAVIMSVWRSARLQGQDPGAVVIPLLCSPSPAVAALPGIGPSTARPS